MKYQYRSYVGNSNKIKNIIDGWNNTEWEIIYLVPHRQGIDFFIVARKIIIEQES